MRAGTVDLCVSAHGLGAPTGRNTTHIPLTAPEIGHKCFSLKANTGHHFDVCIVFHYATAWMLVLSIIHI